jgi:hypothetical protein
MFRKARIAAVITTAAIIAMPAILDGCSAVGYTGTAIIKEHRQSGKNCIATLETPDHATAEYTMGLRDTCDTITDGTTVTMENGFYKK